MANRDPDAWKQRPIAWLDLETTGTNEHLHEICELGIVVTSPDLADVFYRRSWAVRPERPDWPDHVDKYVSDMHTKSGLFTDTTEWFGRGSLDAQLSADLILHFGAEHLTLAGSGVAHFDRRFLKEQMPLVNGRFTYFALDVGVMRRFCQLYAPDLVLPAGDGIKQHRALEDAELHLAEARHYRWVLEQLAPMVPAFDAYIRSLESQ